MLNDDASENNEPEEDEEDEEQDDEEQDEEDEDQEDQDDEEQVSPPPPIGDLEDLLSQHHEIQSLKKEYQTLKMRTKPKSN